MFLYPRREPGDYDVRTAFPQTVVAPRAARPAPLPRGANERLVRDVERVWRPLFARAGDRYEPAKVASFGDPAHHPCAPPEESLLGLYCPDDKRIFLLPAPDDPDWSYVVAHEVGHHVQRLRGTLSEVEEEVRRRPASVVELDLREELQADCYAGVWSRAAGGTP